MTEAPAVGTTQPSRGVPSGGALSGLRILDMAGPIGNYCGRMFVGLGADVILVEKPEGGALRRLPPFIDDVPGTERSLPFAYTNAGKRSIVLDLDDPSGQETFRRLSETCHLIVESERPGYFEERSLDYASLSRSNPRLVQSSITAFGKEGPYAEFLAEDLVGLAMGGLLYLAGYPDTAPMAAFGRQAYSAASMFGAVASLLSVYAAEQTGVGEEVDVSMQECVSMGLETAVQFYDLERTVRKRYAGKQRNAGTGLFRCKDGYVLFMAGGVGGHRFWKMSTEWLIAQGVAGAEQFREPKWQTHEYINTDEAKEIFETVFHPFAMSRTKMELYEEAQAAHLPIAPLSTVADLIDNPQLRQRRFFVEMTHHLVDHPFLAPGAPYRLSKTPWSIEGQAPLLGEHTAEILAELDAVSIDKKARSQRA
jgi:benzylsuccinate CoA-transferase BbsE subunit